MYRLQRVDLYKASTILGETFQNYPIFTFIITNRRSRKNNLKYLCNFLLNIGIQQGEVIGTSNKLEGVSIWLPSMKPKNSGTDAIKAGFANLLFHISPVSIIKFIKVGSIKAKKRSELNIGKFVICDMIGIDPRFQRHGFGRQIIDSKLNELDTSDIPCYLETSKSENIEYYKRYKFTKIREYKIQDVDVFCLLREPQKGITAQQGAAPVLTFAFGPLMMCASGMNRVK
jgi:ribosomal protein S18 acetylase RimI-like enzyme